MRFRLVAVGRVRDAGLRATCEEYRRRITHYIPFDIRECAEGGGSDPATVRSREAKAVRSVIPDGATVVALTRGGREYDSRGFAAAVTRWHEAARDVLFIIGGAHGLDPDVLDRAHERLSLSSLTWPHDVARLLLLEQLYRANTIRRGEPYHKGD